MQIARQIFREGSMGMENQFRQRWERKTTIWL